MNVAELFARNAERNGDRVTVIYEGVGHRAADLRATADRLAGGLLGLGVGMDDRVAVMMPNSPDVPLAYDAVARIGAVCVPMLFLLAPGEIRLICQDATPKVFMTSPEFVANVDQAIAGLDTPPHVLVAGTPEYEAFLSAAEPHTGILDRAAEDLAVVSFTGGTTGRPKGVMLTHGNLLAEIAMIRQVLDYSPDAVSLGVLPLAHLFGLASVLSSQEYGFRSVLLRWFTPEGFLRAVQEHRVTTTAVVPTMLSLLLNHPDFESSDLSSLETVVVGAAPLPIELANEWERRTGSTILQGYGMTETTAGAVIDRPDREKRPGSCGMAYPGCEVVVMDDDNMVLPPGETGEICFRGANVTTGYWRNPDATSAAIVDGWLHSGDVGHIDADGYVYVTERKKDLIIRGGLNIYPRDVEEVLYAHPAVAEAAVVGRPDPDLGERVVACVVLRPGSSATAEELHAWCVERLAKYKTPAEVRFFDQLPKSGIGKILKRDLRDQLAQVPSSS